MISRNSVEMAPTTIMRHAYAVYPAFAMLAGMQLDVFTPLEHGAMNARNLARALGVQPQKLEPLLYALVTAGLLTVEEGVFANTPEADRFLVRGRPEYMGGLCGFYNALWQAALKTSESIRTGKPQAKLDWTSLPEEELDRYFRSQYTSSLRAGRQLAQRIDFSGCRRLLDGGGGSGGLCIGICETCPDLEATVADLPEVVRLSERFISEAGLYHRIKTLAVDLVDGPPEGLYDAAVLRALLQTLSPDKAQKVLANTAQALEPGGVLYIVGCVLDDSRLSPPASMAFSLVFLNVYDDGHAYTMQEHRQWLFDAGFTDVAIEHNVFSDGLGLVSAIKR